jgi:hypothetical protein
MRELDLVEQRLKQQQQQAAEGLKLVGAMRKMLNGTTPAAIAVPGRKHDTKPHPLLSAAARRKQKAASKAYWAKVRSGEIKRPGYKGKVDADA